MENQPGFFEFAAEVGLTKHIGGCQATETLIESCQHRQRQISFECGLRSGITPCFLGKNMAVM